MKNRNKIIMIFILTQSLKVIADNGLGIAEGGDFFAQNFNRNTAVQILQKS